jgi:hypothetical protein
VRFCRWNNRRVITLCIARIYKCLAVIQRTVRSQSEHDKDHIECMLDEAIALKEEALSLMPYDRIDRACSPVGLSHSLRERDERSGDDFFLVKFINARREELSLRPHDHPGRAHS